MAHMIPVTDTTTNATRSSKKSLALRVLFFSLALATCFLVGINLLLYVSHGQSASQVSGTSSPFQGTDLGATVAPTFQLVDQTGTNIALQQLHGSPVVLTFLYTTCPGPCPLTAEKLHTAAQTLGTQAKHVQWLAVSVDPKGDTPALATAFVKAHRLTGLLHFLLGNANQLQPVWKSYAVSSQPIAGGMMTHSVGVYVIDAQGRERVYLDSSFTPAMLATDLHLLLKR